MKIGKINKISSSRIVDKLEIDEKFHINDFGISKKYQGDGIVVCILGSGLPSHDKLPKASIFENFTEEKDPMVDVVNFSTIGAGLLSGDGFGLLPDAEIIFPKIIDNKGIVLLSSLLSGLLWACIKQVNIVVLPCSIPDEFLSELINILQKLNKLGIIVVMPVEKNEESLEILKTDCVLGVKTAISKDNIWSAIEEKKNLMAIYCPKDIKVISPLGVYKYARLLPKEFSTFVMTSLVGAICSRRKKKKFSVSYKDVYPDLLVLKKV